MDATSFLKNILQTATVADARSAPFVAFVDSVPSDDLVSIYRPEEDATSAFLAKVLTPFVLVHDDIVVAVQIGRTTLVLGRIEPVAPVPFVIRNGLRIWNNGNFRMYSDAGITQKIWLENGSGTGFFATLDATANIHADGNISADGTIIGLLSDTNRVAVTAFSNATVSSTTNTSTYQEACNVNLSLPPGSWEVSAFGGSSLSHSASSSVNTVIEIDGVTDTARTVSLPDTGPMPVWDTHERTVSGNRTVLIRTLYKASAAGTVACRNPFVFAVARRVA